MSEGQPSNPITKNAPKGETGSEGTGKPGTITGKPEPREVPLDYSTTKGTPETPEKPYTLDGE